MPYMDLSSPCAGTLSLRVTGTSVSGRSSLASEISQGVEALPHSEQPAWSFKFTAGNWANHPSL